MSSRSFPVPSPSAASPNEPDTRSLTDHYVLGNYARFDLAAARAEGSRLWDEQGRGYLDFSGGVAVTSLGHSPLVMQNALREQSARLIHCSNLFHIRQQGLLARFLAEDVMQRPGRSFFCNSGAEANEAMIKLARRFGHVSAAADGLPRQHIITFTQSFHGRTLGAMSATAQAKIRQGFGDLLPHFTYLPFNDSEALRNAVTADTVAILLEPIQGEGGVHVAAPGFLQTLADLRAGHDLLLLFDEVQCGLGRVGDWCGWRALDGGDRVEPDAVSWAKGIAGGFPLGAVWISEQAVKTGNGERPLNELLGPGSHGSTYGGSPLACAVGLAVLEEVKKQDLLQHTKELGQYIRRQLLSQPVPGVTGVRGLGLLLGLELDESLLRQRIPLPDPASPVSTHVVKNLLANGLLTAPAGPDIVRFLPPLNVSEQDVDEALAILRQTLDQLL